MTGMVFVVHEVEVIVEGDFFAGWARGLQDYTQRTAGAFNMSNDMAKRTAQAMEQGFQQFFFDGMEGKFEFSPSRNS